MARYTNLDDIIAKLDKDIEDPDEKVPIHWIKTWLNMQPTADVVPKIEWISVDERLPEVAVYVLITDGKNVSKGYVLNMDKGLCPWVAMQPVFHRDVTHWMPLPEPPKGE